MRFQRQNNVPNLDAFRGLLSLWVFFDHVNYFDPTLFDSFPKLNSFFKGGQMGVDGFFALSGFIMTHVYQKSFDESFQSFKIEKFLKDYFKFLYYRIARIWPLHAAMSALWIKPYMFRNRCTFSEYIQEISFTTPLINPKTWVGDCNVPSWSIINEFYAYLAFPFLYFALTKVNKNNSTSKNLLMIVAFLLILVVWKALFHFFRTGEWVWLFLTYFKINLTIFEFFAGMAFYRIYLKYPTKHWINDCMFLFLTACIVVLCINFKFTDYYAYYSYLILVFPFLLSKMNSFMAVIFGADVFKFLGDISFSFYLSQVFWINTFSDKANLFFIYLKF